MITLDQLKLIYREASEERLSAFIDPLNDVLQRFEINTPQRIRMFLAQIGHESAQFRYLEELASGEAYENRKDLGNTSPGDGVRYKGRGVIQITGKSNYALAALALDLPLLEHPELLAQLPHALESAGWFWSNGNLNSLCDLGLFERLTKRINGGLNGYADRYKLYQRAFDVIK